MAEGLLRHLAPDRFEPLSAGVHPAGFVHEHAIQALAEIGIDIHGQCSKAVEDFLEPWGKPPRVLISLCEYANEVCPRFPPDVLRIHWPVDDPITARGSIDDRMRFFRRVRDEIRSRIEKSLAGGALERKPRRPTDDRASH
jgi:arsenate reductase